MRVLLFGVVLLAAFHASLAGVGFLDTAFQRVKGSVHLVLDTVEGIKEGVENSIQRNSQINKGISNKLYVKFGSWVTDPLRKNSYFALPRSLNGLTDTEDESWRITEDALRIEGVFVACRNNDYRVCLLVDQKYSVAGLRISVSAADMRKSQYALIKPCQKQNYMFGTEVFSTTIFFVDQSIIHAGGRDMTEDTLTAPNGFYLDTGDKGIRHIPMTEYEISETTHTRQNCYPGMGRHYFYEMTPKSDCNSLDGLFGLYNEQSHDLAGVGFLSYGKNRTPIDGRSWFKGLNARTMKKIAPGIPACASQFINKHGTHALHIFVVDKPWRLTCEQTAVIDLGF